MENEEESNDWTSEIIRTLIRSVCVLWNGDFQDMLDESALNTELSEKLLEGWTAIQRIMLLEFPDFKLTPRQICCKYQELFSNQENIKDPIDKLLEVSRESQKMKEIKYLQNVEQKIDNQELSIENEKKHLQNKIKMLKKEKQSKEAELNHWSNILHKVENNNYEDIIPFLK